MKYMPGKGQERRYEAVHAHIQEEAGRGQVSFLGQHQHGIVGQGRGLHHRQHRSGSAPHQSAVRKPYERNRTD